MTLRTTQVISLFFYVWGGVCEKEEISAFLGVLVVREGVNANNPLLTVICSCCCKELREQSNTSNYRCLFIILYSGIQHETCGNGGIIYESLEQEQKSQQRLKKMFCSLFFMQNDFFRSYTCLYIHTFIFIFILLFISSFSLSVCLFDCLSIFLSLT